MRTGVVREISPGENRVALVPRDVARLVQDGIEVSVEQGAGAGAYCTDDQYRQAGAEIADAGDLLSSADVLVKVAPPARGDAERDEPAMLRSGGVLVGMLDPLGDNELMDALAAANVSALALELLPRITRAQSMDVLSSMATVAGYKAVLMAADAMRRMLPMMMTAAGTLAPARALVIGTGVAGLQAIATARRLGAIVKGVDTRPAAGEQVQSLGAEFVPLEVDHAEAESEGGYARDLGEEFYRGEQEILAPHLIESDLVVTTAMIPGRRAPLLITEETVRRMKPGAVIVDLAARTGGNCSVSQPDEWVVIDGVTVLAPLNLPAALASHASQMYSRNVSAFLRELVDEDGKLRLDTDDEIIRGTLVTHEGRIVNPAVLKAMGREVPS